MTYADKLKDPRWQRKRLEIFQRDDFVCCSCMDSTTTLHVHHLYYVKGRQPWEYPDWALVTRCEMCHKDEDGSEAQDWETLLSYLVENEQQMFSRVFDIKEWESSNPEAHTPSFSSSLFAAFCRRYLSKHGEAVDA